MGLKIMWEDFGKMGKIGKILPISSRKMKKSKRGPFLKGFSGVGRRKIESPPKGGHGRAHLGRWASLQGQAPGGHMLLDMRSEWEAAPGLSSNAAGANGR